MERESRRIVSGRKAAREPKGGLRQAGSAILAVLIALVILLPLALTLSALVLRWQRQSIEFRDLLTLEYAAWAGFERAGAELRGGSLSLEPEGSTSFNVDDAGAQVSVSVHRQEDVVLGLDGRVLEGFESTKVDLNLVGLDPEMRRVRFFQKLEVYLVEVRASARPSHPTVRLWGVFVRPEKGDLRQVGIRLERGWGDNGEKLGGGTPQFKSQTGGRWSAKFARQ